MNRWKIDEVESKLQFCPTCGKRLELNPVALVPACFMHGDFRVIDANTVEFKLTNLK